MLGNSEAIFPYKYPALISVIAAFFTIWLVSTLDKSESGKQEQMAFDQQYADAFKN